MNNDEFVEKLKEVGLNKKDFAVKTGLAYSTVANWSVTQNIPKWVHSWLENYIKAKNFDEVINAVKPYIQD